MVVVVVVVVVVVGTVAVVLEVAILGVGGGGGAEEQKGKEEGQVEWRSRHGCSAADEGKAAAAETVWVVGVGFIWPLARAESAVRDGAVPVRPNGLCSLGQQVVQREGR